MKSGGVDSASAGCSWLLAMELQHLPPRFHVKNVKRGDAVILPGEPPHVLQVAEVLSVVRTSKNSSAADDIDAETLLGVAWCCTWDTEREELLSKHHSTRSCNWRDVTTDVSDAPAARRGRGRHTPVVAASAAMIDYSRSECSWTTSKNKCGSMWGPYYYAVDLSVVVNRVSVRGVLDRRQIDTIPLSACVCSFSLREQQRCVPPALRQWIMVHTNLLDDHAGRDVVQEWWR